jgi:hypothetical protein
MGCKQKRETIITTGAAARRNWSIFILFSPNQKNGADLKRFLGHLPQGWEEPV